MRGWPTLLLILLLGETSSHRPDVRANRPALKRDRSRAYGEGELRIRDRNSLAEQLAAARQRIAELEDVEVGPVRGVSVSVGVAGLTPGAGPDALLGAAALALEEARAAGGSQVAVRPRRRPGAGRLSVRSPPGGLGACLDASERPENDCDGPGPVPGAAQ